MSNREKSPVFQAKFPQSRDLIIEGAGLMPEMPDKALPTWRGMEEAPLNRQIFVSADPDADPDGTLSYWRVTRQKHLGKKGWHTTGFWASVLTHRALPFEAFCWRESMAVREMAG